VTLPDHPCTIHRRALINVSLKAKRGVRLAFFLVALSSQGVMPDDA
jgi:hypothetical protein